MSDTETDWAEKIGKSAMACLRDMVAALECDYDRLTELKEERESLADAVKEAKEARNGEAEAEAAELAKALDEAGLATNEAENNLSEWDEENTEELKDLTEAAGDCTDRDDAEQRIHEDPLSVQVRSDWVDVVSPDDTVAAEFQILLSTGGPATRIMGELDANGEPRRAWLEVQDWYKPWTDYHEADGDVLLAYCRCFVFTA